MLDKAVPFNFLIRFVYSTRNHLISFDSNKRLIIMREYAKIEKIQLSNGKTIKEVNEEVRKEVERIYLEGWTKGISIPFWDKEGNYLFSKSRR